MPEFSLSKSAPHFGYTQTLAHNHNYGWIVKRSNATGVRSVHAFESFEKARDYFRQFATPIEAVES